MCLMRGCLFKLECKHNHIKKENKEIEKKGSWMHNAYIERKKEKKERKKKETNIKRKKKRKKERTISIMQLNCSLSCLLLFPIK